MSTKRVFILGAGFSKQAGMPLATELTGCLLKKSEEYNDQEMLGWFDYFKQRISWIQSTTGEISVEQVFDLAKFDTELWKMKQHLCPVGRQYGDTPWNASEGIEAWLDHMQDDLRDIIWGEQKKAQKNLELICRSSKHLNSDDAVLTFNYDTLLENSLSQQKKPWHYGFKREKGTGISIFKMHGSINWLVTQRGNSQNFQDTSLLFRKEDKNKQEGGERYEEEVEYDFELLRVPDERLGSFIENRDLQRQATFYEIGVAGLGSYKPLHVLPGSGEVWFNAMKALQEAEEIYVVGFSLSPFDNMVRLHFGGVMCERNEKKDLPTKVTLVDPYAHQLQENFRSVFGPDISMKICKQKAEETEWVQLLSH